MNAEQTSVQDFLRGYPGIFVSVTEISRRLGARRKFQEDRTWARPILRRMEMDGTLESNECGEYRLKAQGDETTSFKKALTKPGIPLGDTTIISLDEDELAEQE